jgi:hypothetical protein
MYYTTNDIHEGLVNQIIKQIRLDEEYLIFELENSKQITLEAYGDCCSQSVFYDFFGVKDILNQKVIEFEEIELENEEAKELVNSDRNNYQEAIQIYGYRIKTENGGLASFSFRNYSNGYYGGSLEKPYCDLDPREVLLMPVITQDVFETVKHQKLNPNQYK